MARKNSASRPDMQAAFDAGATSQTGIGPQPKPSADAGDIHDNKTSGAGIFVRNRFRSASQRKNASARSRG